MSGTSQKAVSRRKLPGLQFEAVPRLLQPRLNLGTCSSRDVDQHGSGMVQVARGELELLRDSRSALSKLTSRVTKLKQVRSWAFRILLAFHCFPSENGSHLACLVGVCSLI